MNIKKIIALSFLTFVATLDLCAKSENQNKTHKEKIKTPILGGSPYTHSPKIFTADNDVTGYYWAGKEPKYPAKAFIGQIEYTKIVVIKKITSTQNQQENYANIKIILVPTLMHEQTSRII